MSNCGSKFCDKNKTGVKLLEMIYEFNGTIIEFNGQIIALTGETPTPTITPTPTPTITPTPTPTPTVTPTPTPAPTPSSSELRLLVLGDASANTVATSLSGLTTSLGYTVASVTGITMGTTYTGAGLSPNDYNCILYYTNSSQIGSTALTTNLLTYLSNGGNLVTGVFTWNLRPSNWSYSGLTNFVGGVNQTSNNTNINVLQSHPIFSGVSSAITNNQSYFVNDIVSIQPGSTTLANLTSNSRPFLTIRTTATSRLVSVNTFPPGVTSYTNMRRLYTNSVLWAAGIIT